MPIALVTALISAGGLVLGSVIGAICSLFINRISLHEQERSQKENLNYQEKCKCQEKYINANIIRLDFCNAIYQSIRFLQNNDNSPFCYSMPMYKEYNKVVASLCDEYSLKELSYIYQLYSILEKTSKIIDIGEYKELETIINIRSAFVEILKKIYGENYMKVLSKNIDNISYEQLYSDPLMKNGYRDILKSLDEVCKMGYNAKR